MSMDDSIDPARQIVDLLNDERAALLSGDSEALQKITIRKQLWIDELPSNPLSLNLEKIQKIKALSDQNGALSKSCQIAQKSVIRRLGEIQNIEKNLGVYGNDGNFSSQNGPEPTIEKRA